MKRFENVKMTLFDSTNAYFKLAVEAQFTRKNPDGSYRDLVYTTDRGTSILNPNIYLTLSYKDDNMNAVYTSYPQLYLIRDALERVKSMLLSDDAFILDPNDNSLSVKQTYSDSVVVDNIGKNNNWIALKLCAIRTGENGVYNYTKGVTLELSTSNGYASQLSTEEFLTVYTIIKDLNLSTLQCMMSLGFLNCEARVMNVSSGYSQQQYYGQTTLTPGYAQLQNQGYVQQPPMNGNWANQNQQPTYMAPRYNSQPRTPSYRTQSQPYDGSNQTYYTKKPGLGTNKHADGVPSYVNDSTPPYSNGPVFTSQPSAAQQSQTLPPRGTNKPIMNMKAVEETPVSNYDIDDASALDAIFGND